MPTTLQGIRWKCEACKLSGMIFPERESSIASLAFSIRSAHTDRSPKCPTRDNEIEVIEPKRAIRQHLSYAEQRR
jgi:hypothetical protein